jgi:hypothetical protein
VVTDYISNIGSKQGLDRGYVVVVVIAIMEEHGSFPRMPACMRPCWTLCSWALTHAEWVWAVATHTSC